MVRRRCEGHGVRQPTQTGRRPAAPAPAPPTLGCLGTSEDDGHGSDAGQYGCMGWHAEPAENRSDVGDVEPERSDELATRCVPRINEIIVVPLKEVVAVLDQDDAVQHRLVQHLALVEDDFAHVIARLSTDDRKVALVQQGVHADAVGDRISRCPAELRWRKEGP